VAVEDLDDVVIAVDSARGIAAITGLPAAGKKFLFSVRAVDSNGNVSKAVNVTARTAKFPPVKLKVMKGASAPSVNTITLETSPPRNTDLRLYSLTYQITVSYTILVESTSTYTTFYSTIEIAADGQTPAVVTQGQSGDNQGGFYGRTAGIGGNLGASIIAGGNIQLTGLPRDNTRYVIEVTTFASEIDGLGRVESSSARVKGRTSK
jgi:hypothetical protein